MRLRIFGDFLDFIRNSCSARNEEIMSLWRGRKSWLNIMAFMHRPYPVSCEDLYVTVGAKKAWARWILGGKPPRCSCTKIPQPALELPKDLEGLIFYPTFQVENVDNEFLFIPKNRPDEEKQFRRPHRCRGLNIERCEGARQCNLPSVVRQFIYLVLLDTQMMTSNCLGELFELGISRQRNDFSAETVLSSPSHHTDLTAFL